MKLYAAMQIEDVRKGVGNGLDARGDSDRPVGARQRPARMRFLVASPAYRSLFSNVKGGVMRRSVYVLPIAALLIAAFLVGAAISSRVVRPARAR